MVSALAHQVVWVLDIMKGRKNRALQVPPVVPYKTLGIVHCKYLPLSHTMP